MGKIVSTYKYFCNVDLHFPNIDLCLFASINIQLRIATTHRNAIHLKCTLIYKFFCMIFTKNYQLKIMMLIIITW